MRTRKVIQTQLVCHSAALAFIWIAFLIRNTQNKVSLEKRKLLSDGQHEKCWVLNDGGWDCEMDELRGTCSALLRFEGCLRGVTFHSSRLRWWRMLGGNWNEWRKSKGLRCSEGSPSWLYNKLFDRQRHVQSATRERETKWVKVMFCGENFDLEVNLETSKWNFLFVRSQV